MSARSASQHPDGFLHHGGRHARGGLRGDEVDLLFQLLGRVGGARDAAQQVEQVAAQVPVLLQRRVGVGQLLEPIEGGGAGRGAMGFQKHQDQAALLAARLDTQILEQAARRELVEELHDLAQQRVLVGVLHHAPQHLVADLDMALRAHRLEHRRLDAPLGDDLAGEVDHGHGRPQGSFVEPVDGGGDQLAEAQRALGAILGEGDEAVHRRQRTGGGHRGLGAGLLALGDRDRPAGQAAAQVTEELVHARVEAQLPQPLQVLVELAAAAAAGGRGGEGLGHQLHLRLGCGGARQPAASRAALEPLQQHREAPQRAHRLLARGRASALRGLSLSAMRHRGAGGGCLTPVHRCTACGSRRRPA
jgi:hypothetical protein